MDFLNESDEQDEQIKLWQEHEILAEPENRPAMVRNMAMADAQRYAQRHGSISWLADNIREILIKDSFNKATELNLLEKRDWEDYRKAFK